MRSLEPLQNALGYRFRDERLLELALTHRSLVRDGQGVSNQRLEFLGDAVLGLAVAGMLYELYPTETEGDLSKRLVGLVNGQQLAVIAREIGLGQYLFLSAGEDEQGGRENPSNLEDALEALLGAIYRDGGFEAAREIIARIWKSHAESSKTPPKDAKTALQEWAQGCGLPLPEYIVVSADGPSHAPNFVIELRVKGCEPVRAEAGVKKTAERLAAEKLLAIVGSS